MAEISEVPGITGSTLELFREADVGSIESLLALSGKEILAKLDEANARYEVAVRRPSEELVIAWQNAGRAVLRKRAEEQAPAAKMVPEENLRAAGIDVSSVPMAKVVEVESPPPAPVPQKEPKKKAVPTGPKVVKAAPQAAPRSKAKIASPVKASPRAKPKAPVEEPKRSAAPNVKFKPLDDVRNSTPQGQRRNRGMSHPEAGRVRWAAIVTVLTPIIAVLNALALVSALVMARFYGWEFHWTIALLLLVFPFCLMLYLSQGAKVRCRLCGQKLFVPKHCRKHESASRSIFGHTFAVARSAMFFANYRCMLCGTKTRLRD